jgi:hypothetical protein
VDEAAALADLTARHSQALFGHTIDRAAVTVTPLALSTRRVFTVRAADPRLPVLIAKRRVAGPRMTPQAVESSTAYEFDLHSAVWNSLQSAGVPGHQVPRPVLALPPEGLLFMERAAGEPVKQSLQRGVWRVGERRANVERVARCGAWLHTFSCKASRIALPAATDATKALVAASRAGHHVYSLIGLQGRDLVDAMLGQVRRRLAAYRVPADFVRRIDEAFVRTLSGAGALDQQGNVHGKYSVEDVLTAPGSVVAIDLEQAGHGSPYLDAAYFLFQVGMVVRWNVFSAERTARELRHVFLSQRSPAGELDERVLAAFVAYYLVNSLRPGDGVAGLTARAFAKRWIGDWLKTA